MSNGRLRMHITGIRGLLGAEVARALRPLGEVHGTDVTEMDVSQLDQVLRVLGAQPPDIIVHVAALKGNLPSRKRPGDFFAVNTVGTFNLLEACRRLNIKRFIFVSSLTVHGASDAELTEDDAWAPRHPYAGSKGAAEAMVQAYAHTYGIDAVIFRPNFIVGPISPPAPYADNIIYDFLEAIHGSGVIELAGDGSFQREWLHPQDVAAAIRRAVEVPMRGCEVFLLSGNRVTMRELAERVIRRVGAGRIVTNPARSGFSLMASSHKAARVLGWRPQHDLNTIIAEIWEEYQVRKHPRSVGASAAPLRTTTGLLPQDLRINEVRQISLEMAGGCNLRCPMCPQSTGREKEFTSRLPMEEFRNIIDQAVPLGLKFVILSGSGEPLLHTGLEEAVAYLSARNVETLVYTNGTLLTPERFERLCQAGLTVCKISCQGWDRESYAKWMSVDAFDRVREYLKAAVQILQEKGYPTLLQTNHLIHNYAELEYETAMYLKNWVEYLGVKSEIWLAHNWAGQYDNTGVDRAHTFAGRRRRSCGRPLAPVMEIRAGGLNGKRGAVVPCPYVLGMDSKAVMSHTEDTPLLEAFNSEQMLALRAAHLRGDFDAIDICRNCDQLLDVQESLVWTNIEGRTYGTSRISLLNYFDYVPKPAEPAPTIAG